MECPSDELISLCAEKSLGEKDEARVLAHADGCAPCREVLAGLVAAVAEERIGRLETPRSPLEPLETSMGDLPKIGTHVGRYEILERLGAGGMGVVYRARWRTRPRYRNQAGSRAQ